MLGHIELLRRSAVRAVNEYNALVPVDADEPADYPPLLDKVMQVLNDVGAGVPEPESDTFKFDAGYVEDVIACIELDQFDSWKDLVELFKWVPEDADWPTLPTTLPMKCSYVNIEQHERMTRHEHTNFQPEE